jgi:hypothetical protein
VPASLLLDGASPYALDRAKSVKHLADDFAILLAATLQVEARTML